MINTGMSSKTNADFNFLFDIFNITALIDLDVIFNTPGKEARIKNRSFTTAAADPNLVALWKFNETSGSTTADSSGHGWTGTLASSPNTPSWNSSGKEGYCLNFANLGSVTVSDDVVSSINNRITLTFWAYGNAGEPQMHANFFIYGASGGIIQASLVWDSAAKVLWLANSSWADQILKDITDSTWTECYWNHWAFTKNTSTGYMRIYHNGSEWHSGTGLTRTISGANASSCNVGSYISGQYSYDGRDGQCSSIQQGIDIR